MIKRLLMAFRNKMPQEPVKEEELDLENIYVRLKLAVDLIGTKTVSLTANKGSLGRIDSFSESLEELLKSLMEVNHALKEKTHIDNGLFYVKKVHSVRFDKFLFVRNGFYVNDADETLEKVFNQIEVYYEHMKTADKATYGAMEHNHRQLYSYTETLIGIISAIFHHFGS